MGGLGIGHWALGIGNWALGIVRLWDKNPHHYHYITPLPHYIW